MLAHFVQGSILPKVASGAHLLGFWGGVYHPDDLVKYASSTALEVPFQVAVQYPTGFGVLYIASAAGAASAQHAIGQ